MRRDIHVGTSFLMMTLVASASLALTDALLRTGQEVNGTHITVIRQHGESITPLSTQPVIGGNRAGEILWHRYLEDPIYTTVGISMTEELVWAGNYLNDPRQVEAIPLVGDGTPNWTHPGTEFYADASRASGVLAAIDYVPADSTITVREFAPGSSIPLWSYEIHPCRALSGDGWAQGKGIHVSDDGSTIAVIVNMFTPEGFNGRLHVFDSGSGTPAIVYDLPDGNASAMAVTPSGAYIAIYAWPNVYVYDRYGETLRWSGPSYSGNDAIAISGDGRWLAWGWYTFYLREWNGSSYQLAWTDGYGGSYYVGECALSNPEDALAIAWYKGGTYDDNIIRMYDLPSHDLRWEYSYGTALAEGTPGYSSDQENWRATDVASEVVFSPDGSHLAISSWGAVFPEIHVFESAAPAPLMTLDTPGTMFDIDIAESLEGDVYVSACGKHVHAGYSGRGGDLYAIRIPGEPTAAPDSRPVTPFDLSMIAQPNPFQTRTTLHLHSSAGPVRLTVHDVSGREVAALPLTYATTSGHTATWDGRDASGRLLPSGVYLINITSGREARSRQIVMLR